MRSLNGDVALGKKGEIDVFETLKLIDPTLRPAKNTFDRTDFYGERARVEHKTRTNAYADYPTTLMPCDKAIPGETPLYFSFGFTDGVYIIEYTPEAFADIEVAPFCRNRRAGYIDRPKQYFHIPIERLTRLA